MRVSTLPRNELERHNHLQARGFLPGPVLLTPPACKRLFGTLISLGLCLLREELREMTSPASCLATSSASTSPSVASRLCCRASAVGGLCVASMFCLSVNSATLQEESTRTEIRIWHPILRQMKVPGNGVKGRNPAASSHPTSGERNVVHH